MFSAAVACTAMIDGALSDWLRIGKVDPPCWCPVFPYGVAAVAAGEPAHSKPRGIKFLHLNLPASCRKTPAIPHSISTSKKHRIYWPSEDRFREGYSVHPAVTSLSPPWTPPSLQWPRFLPRALRVPCLVIRTPIITADAPLPLSSRRCRRTRVVA